MKKNTFLQSIIVALLFILFSNYMQAQTCDNVASFDEENLGVLTPYNGMPGYFGDYGAPEYVAEGCPVGTGSQGIKLKASIDGSLGDGLGYTLTGGINPQPTFMTGTSYHIAGKKLLSESTMGAYSDIVMTIRLSNVTNNGLACNGPDCIIIHEKVLMLSQGVCESWDPPYEFVSPGDYNYMIISISAFSDDGSDELYIIIDDWCVEPVENMGCAAEFQFIQEDCGKVQFTNLTVDGTVIQWDITDPNNEVISSDEDSPCLFFTVGGLYKVTLTVLCGDGSISTSEELFFEIAQDLPPFFENCNEGETIVVEGQIVDGICNGEYVFPEIFAYDDGIQIIPNCTFDGVPASAGQVFNRPAGIYDVICTLQDECHDPVICFFQVEIICEDEEPCDYICCEDGPNWPVEDMALGSLPNSNQAGYYPEYGDPQVVNDGCDGSVQGVQLLGVTQLYKGDAVGIRYSGILPDTAFVFGNTYCISYCMKVTGGVSLSTVLDLQASTSDQTDNSCSGDCEVIGTSNIVNQADGWTNQQIIYTPSDDFENLILLNNNTGIGDFPPTIIIDNVCISIAEPIYCKADFTIEDQGCGKVLFNAETCGEVESLLWLWDDGFESFESDTFNCQEYPTEGPWSVTLIVNCMEGVSDTITKTFMTSADTIAPILTCPNDTIIYLGTEVECVQQYLLGNYIIDDVTATVKCYQSGFPILDPTVPIVLQEGLTEITYIAQDTCGNLDSCSYTITLDCEPISDPKYDCPIDVLFIMDNSGSIDGSEYGNMAASALAEINAISGVYTNSKFGVVHYSGLCGNEISIEHDFSPASGISSINRQFSTIYPGFMDDLNESLDAVINALNGTPDVDIVSGALTPDPLADLYIVIFADAAPWVSLFPGGCTNSALLPYTNANILKNTYNANISVVHFVPGFADAECAAIASQGGTWTGVVGNNPGDPTNPVGPRQYIPATFTTPNIDLLTILPPCEPCYDCDDLEVTFEETSADSCCYSIDIVNGIGPEIVKLEAEIITSDWQFNTASTNPGSGYKWYPGSIPTSNKVCITGASDFIPSGANSDVLEYCFSEANSTPTLPQIVVFRWYSLLNDTLFELHCTDTLITECIPDFNDPCVTVDDIEINCNEDNAYEYIVNISVTNNSGFNASHITLGGLDPGFLFANCTGGSGTLSLSIPIPGGLPDGASTTQCFKIIAPIPILNPQLICFDIGIYSFFDCCHSPEEVCITIDPCCDPCEDINTTYTTLTVPGQNQCCYTLEVDYGCDYLYFDKIKVHSVTSGVTFGYHALGDPLWQMCGSSSTELCIKPIAGPISKGNYTNLLDICFDEITDPSQIPQTVRIDYITTDPTTNLDSVACSQDLVFECEIAENECLEVSNQSLVCIPDSNKYEYTFTITNKSTIAFNATDVDVFIFSPSDLYFDPSGGTFPFTTSLGYNQSETITACIKSTSFPSTAPNVVFGYRLRYNSGDTCCYESVLDTIPIPPCGDECCDDEEEFLNLIALGFQVTDLGDCTYEVCANQFDTCHWFGTIGPDWGDGTGAPSQIIQSDPPNNCWTHTYTTSGPHKISMHVFEGDIPSDEICWSAELCSYIENDCPTDDPDCFTVVDIEMKGITCDTTDCYENPFCQSWLIDEIGNLNCFGFGLSSVKKAIYNGQPVFVTYYAAYDLEETKIYACDGTLIQSCFIGITGINMCNPDAGIDILVDLTNVVQIWDCTVPKPIYDPAACISTGGTTVDYCIKIMNNYPLSTATNLDLQSIAPSGINVSPNSIPVNIPAGGMQTVNFSVSGPLFTGDIIKLGGFLSGIDSDGQEFECTDTICLEVPPCPMEDCCEDEEEFNDNIVKGFTVTQLGDCTYQVCANQFDTCHWFGTPGPDWGDGTVNLQVITQSNPPNNCWTHTYSQSGTYKISINVFEVNSSTGDACWGDQLCATVETDCCEDDPCENVNITTQPVSSSSDSCCYDFTIENNFCEDYFKGMRVEVSAPATISQITANAGYVINQLNNNVAEVKPLFGFIPIGSVNAFTLCNTNYTTNPHLVKVSWLVPGPFGTCEEVCPSEFEIGCEIDPPFDKKCFEVVDDSIHCESSTYCFKIKNVSQPSFDINSVDLYDLTGSLGFSPSGRINIPTLTNGNTSDWICVQYTGVNPGDNACFKLSAHNTPANLPPTTCCTDTIATCFLVPDCPMESCAICPEGTEQGPNMIINGDFETGSGYSGGWSSNYDLKLTGLTYSNEYSVRNSTNLINSQWSAVDHTNNSITGNFLTLNGPSPNIAYEVPVIVKPNTNYVFCMWVDNLVNTSTASAPIIRIDIGSNNVISGQLLPKTPDGWQLISINYFSGFNSGLVNIRVRDISTTQFNDWAIDDVSFKECTQISTCCDDEEEFLSQIAQGFQVNFLGDCTYQVCANQFDSCHWFGTLGPDWGDGTGASTAIVQSNPPNNCWTHTYTQPGPHKIAMTVFEGDLPNDEICWSAELCTTIENSCPTENCLSVIDVEMKGIVCDTTDCFENPFCQSWLVDEIANLSCFGIANASVDKATYNGQTVFVTKTSNLDYTETNIYTCDGTLIQSCYWTVPAPATPCNPDAGIDVTTDLTNVTQIWDCNDPLPVYDPVACISAGSTTVDYCVKIMNNHPTGVANIFDLQSLAPAGTIVSPSSFIVSIPPSGMTTVNFSISGPLFPGDIVKLASTLSGLDANGLDFECKDTLCLEVPKCPEEECCTDQDKFDANIIQGFTVTQLGDCTYQVCANQFDSCHWFGTQGPDWGDGTFTLPAILQSNPPNNCWTHTYSQSGTYTIGITVYEGDLLNDETCWSDQLMSTVTTDCCEEDPCDDIDVIVQPISTSGDSCCYDFTIENNFCDDYFKGIKIEVQAPATISQISGLSGYVINQLSNTEAEVRPLIGFIPMGPVKAFELCNTNYTTNPHSVTISWLIPGPNDTCEEICPLEFEIDCDILPPPLPKKCFELVEDSIHCESNTYCFKIKNVSQPAFDINSVDLYDITGSGGISFSPSGRINIPTLTHGSTSDWICIQLSGVQPGDIACYKLSAHNTPANQPPTTCCTDTIETCFIIPECEMETCALCPDGSNAGPNLIQNGDFESGYTGGWYSTYNLKTSNLMGSNEYSIRNSTNLVNGQWQALDHTNNSILGNFLAIDGPSSNIAYGVSVNVKPNTNYVFCMWVDNLVKTSTASAPILRIDVGSTNILSGQLLPKNPDGWQLITLNYYSGTNSGLVDIKVRDIANSGFNDWAIDDVSFRECEEIVSSCCADLDTVAFCNYYDANITLSRDSCEGCVYVDLDSCDIATVDFGNGEIDIEDNVPVCTVFPGNGNYTFIVKIKRLDQNGLVCFEKDFPVSILIDDCTPISTGSCISLIDSELDCENDSYCFRVVNNTSNPGFSFASIALVNESIGHSFNPDPISLGGSLLPGDTSAIICIAYQGAKFGDNVCFDLVGHKEDLAAGEEPTFCCSDTTRYCFEVDCPTGDPCCDVSQQYLCDFLDLGTDFSVDQCELCLPFEEDSCMVVKVDFGDGNISESTGGGQVCHTFDNGGNYSINVLLERYTSDGTLCIEKDTTFEVSVADCPGIIPCDINDLEIFNAMTPNDDGLNDKLIILGDENCPLDIKIYNRWGQMVWSERNYSNGWTGQSFTGEKLPNGTYFLIVEFPFVDSREKRMIQTFIDLRDN